MTPRPAPLVDARTFGWFVLAWAGVFAALSLPSNGWAAGNVLGPEDTPGYFDAVAAVTGGRDALAAPRGTPHGLLHGALFFAALAGVTAAYAAMVRRAWRTTAADPAATRRLLALAAAGAVPVALAPFMLSTDVYSYIVYGRLHAVHDANPYTTPPYLLEDPYQQWVFWHEATLIYGPVWLYLSSSLAWILDRAGAGPGGHVLAFKALALAAHLGTGALLAGIARRTRPERTAVIVAAYVLNPLALLELAGNAHNDAILIFLLVAGVAAHVRGRPYAALALFTLAALTKPHALMFVGVYGLAHVRAAGSLARAARRAAAAAALVAALIAAAYAPVFEGVETFRAFFRDAAANRFLNSLAELLTTAGLDRGAVRVLMNGAFAAAALAIVLRSRTPDLAVRGFVWLALAFCAFASTWFWPWYVVFAVALGVAAGTARAARVAIVLSICAPAVYLTFNLGTPEVPVLRGAVELLHDGRALLVFGPAIAAAVALVVPAARRALAARARVADPAATRV